MENFVKIFIAIGFVITIVGVVAQFGLIGYGVTHATELTTSAAHQACKLRAISMGDKEALKTCEEMEKAK